jgi:hypothetical protein
MVLVTLAPVAVSLVVTDVEDAVPVSAAGPAGAVVVVVVVDWPAGNVGSALGAVVGSVGAGAALGEVGADGDGSVGCAKAAPLIRADAATAVRTILSFMGRVSYSLLKAQAL